MKSGLGLVFLSQVTVSRGQIHERLVVGCIVLRESAQGYRSVFILLQLELGLANSEQEIGLGIEVLGGIDEFEAFFWFTG